MSAVVCGKRSFYEEPLTSPATKRIRFDSPRSNSPVRFSYFDRLLSLFPNMDTQLIEKALEESNNDLDAAIKRLHGLSLGYEAVNSDLGEGSNANMEKGKHSKPRDGTTVIDKEAAPPANLLSQHNIEMGGAEWVELFVQEMMSATSVDDARSRATKVLESLEQSISTRAHAEAAQPYHKENEVLKEQIELLLRENSILKRAVAIQHERQKEYDNKNQEVEHLKQLVTQYQEQMRTLEVNNYALTMHLQQAQQNTSLPGRFNPDIF